MQKLNTQKIISVHQEETKSVFVLES